jgi:hypothetical protein
VFVLGHRFALKKRKEKAIDIKPTWSPTKITPSPTKWVRPPVITAILYQGKHARTQTLEYIVSFFWRCTKLVYRLKKENE